MRRQWFYILLSLAECDRHGSGIMRDVLALTAGRLRLWPVTLYSSLDELLEQGWIRELAAPPTAPDEEPERGNRRWFRMTSSGRRALAAEVTSLNQVVGLAQRRLAHHGESL